MKSQRFFWLLLAIAMATTTGVYFASCHDATSDDLQPKTETVAPTTNDDANTTGNGNTTNDDPEITTRTCCTCSSACPIDINIVSTGSVSLTICGDNNATTNCTITNSNCASNTYFPRSTTIAGSSCICVSPGNIFRVTNNGIANVVIDIIVTGSGGVYPLQTTIPANSFRDFEVDASVTCDAQVTPC